MTRDQLFNQLQYEIAQAIDRVLEDGETWGENAPCYLPDTATQRMAESAVSVLRAIDDHQGWLITEGVHEMKEG